MRSPLLLAICVFGHAGPSVAEPTTAAESSHAIEDIYRLFESARRVAVALKQAVSVDDAAAIVTVIPRELIEERRYRSVAAALREVPGLYIVDDLITQRVGLRGIAGGPWSWSRVIKVLVNGHPITAEPLGGSLMGLALIPIDAVEAIEVIRGPASALYGANAFLGVVNILTTEPGEASAISGTVETGWIHGKQSLGWAAGLQLRDTGAKGRSVWAHASVEGHVEDRSGLEPPGTGPLGDNFAGEKSEDDISRPLSALVRVGANAGRWGELTLQGLYQRVDAVQEFGPTTALTHDTRVAAENLRLVLNHVVKPFDWPVELRTTAQWARYKDLPAQRFRQIGISWRTRRERTHRMLSGAAEVLWTLGSHSVLAGVDYAGARHLGDRLWREFLGGGGRPAQRTLTHPPIRHEYSTSGVFGQGVVALAPRMNLTGAMRYDTSSDWKNSLSSRLALTWGVLENLRIKLLYGESFVPPAPVQIASNPVTTGGSERANPDLDPQSASTYEIGIRYRPSASWTLQANGFLTRVVDRVEYQRQDQYLYATNLTQSLSYGFETSVEIIVPPFYAKGNISASRSSIEELVPTPRWFTRIYRSEDANQDLLPEFPMFMGHAVLGVRLPQYFLKATIALHAASSRNSSGAHALMSSGGAYTLDKYGTVDLTLQSMGLQTPSGESLNVSLVALNVLDERYAEAGYQGVDIPALGREVYLRLAMSL